MRRVAYLNGRAWRGIPMAPGALPTQEEPDYALVRAAGLARGISFEIAYWDDASLPQQGFDAAIIRSCWDYTGRAAEFAARLEAHEAAGLRVFNSARVVNWNARKTYLNELGALAIPTIWTERVDAAVVADAFSAFDAAELVIKPQVGAGSRDTIRLARHSWSEADLRAAPPDPAMIQPYLNEIERDGERSLLWFGGEFSHAVRKVPNNGAWLANRQEAARFFAEDAPASARAVAEQARALTPGDPLYVRIDLVQDGAGWRVIEVEAIEPYLFLAFAPGAAERFVDAVAKALDG